MNLTEIIKITETDIYIEVLTLQDSAYFLDEVLEKIKTLGIDNRKVIFDLVLRNGLNNRLFCAYLQDYTFSEFQKYRSEKAEEYFDIFFKHHFQHIEHSLLSSRDKDKYYERIHCCQYRHTKYKLKK